MSFQRIKVVKSFYATPCIMKHIFMSVSSTFRRRANIPNFDTTTLYLRKNIGER